MKLTIKEIDILIDALEAWETKDAGANLAMDFLGVMLSDNTPEGKARFERMAKQRQEKMELKLRERKETSLLLRAKLVGIKQDILIDNANDILKD